MGNIVIAIAVFTALYYLIIFEVLLAR